MSEELKLLAQSDEEARALQSAFDAAGVDWLNLLKTVTKETWPAIAVAIDGIMVTQRPAVRILWRIAKQAIEAWLATQ